MDLCFNDSGFLEAFTKLSSFEVDENGKTKVDLFALNINANEFDYEELKRVLLNPMIDFAVSRKVREEYKERVGELQKNARIKFVDHLHNKGELGELLLFAFLESHLKAPKILSKLELKTSTNQNVNGADGVHFKKLANGNYQLIFGESKTMQNLTDAITEAFKSIYEFKNGINEKGNEKSGLAYERMLIADHIAKETFTQEEKDFITSIIYPQSSNDYHVDNAFGVFIGFEISISTDEIKLNNEEFRTKIFERIRQEVQKRKAHIENKITEFNLSGHHFYLYVLPFTNLDKSRGDITKYITT